MKTNHVDSIKENKFNLANITYLYKRIPSTSNTRRKSSKHRPYAHIPMIYLQNNLQSPIMPCPLKKIIPMLGDWNFLKLVFPDLKGAGEREKYDADDDDAGRKPCLRRHARRRRHELRAAGVYHSVIWSNRFHTAFHQSHSHERISEWRSLQRAEAIHKGHSIKFLLTSYLAVLGQKVMSYDVSPLAQVKVEVESS